MESLCSLFPCINDISFPLMSLDVFFPVTLPNTDKDICTGDCFHFMLADNHFRLTSAWQLFKDRFGDGVAADAKTV